MKFINSVIAETDEFGGRMILEDDVFDYVRESGIPFITYMDEDDILVTDYNIQTVPFLAFITPEGHLALTRPFTYAQDVSRILDALIAGRKIDTTGMETVIG